MSASLRQAYRDAYEAYSQGDYRRASALFQALVLQGPFEIKYWEGFATVEQIRGNYEQSLHAWAMVSLFDPQSPKPHLSAAECYLARSDRKEAQKALDLAANLLPQAPNREGYIERIRRLKEAL